jgi:hypothetical protein
MRSPSCDLLLRIWVWWNQKVSPSPSSVRLAELASVIWRFLVFDLLDHLFFHQRSSFGPFTLWGCLFFHRGSFFWAPCVLGLHLFLSEVFLLSPLHFKVASFFIGGLSFEPLVFYVCFFFYQRSFFWATCVLGLPLFSSDVFLLSPLHFRVASFLSEVFLLSQRTNVAIMHPRSWLWLTWRNNFCQIRS